MNLDELRAALVGVNLMHFSQAHKLPLRTLVRMRTGAVAPRRATMDAVAKALKREKRKLAAA